MMTSGLDSIALAVAHLEEIGKAPKPTEKLPTTAHSAHEDVTAAAVPQVTGTTAATTTAHRPASFLSAQTARVVSSESIASSSATNATHSTAENDVIPGSTTMVPLPPPPQQPQPQRYQYVQTPMAQIQGKKPIKVPVPPPPPSQEPAGEQTTPNGSNSKNLTLILADPNSWLQATEHIAKLPEPPTGTFDKILQEDVLCGRGGESNHHPGNQQYRRLVKAFQPLYISSKRRDKPRIAQCIVYTIRSYGGRFLKRTTGAAAQAAPPNTQLFEDVGNIKAREKTSQALREGAPELRGGSANPAVVAKELVEVLPSNSSAHNSNQSSPLTVPPTVQPPMPPQGPYLNAQLLQQLPPFAGHHHGAYHPHHHHHHPYFAGPQHLSPLQQALLAAAPIPGTPHVLSAPTGVPPKHGFVEPTAPAPTSVASETNANNKRPLPHVVSSEDNNSTGSSETSERRVRGPRLKRLKHRLQQESTAPDDETTSTTTAKPINTTA